MILETLLLLVQLEAHPPKVVWPDSLSGRGDSWMELHEPTVDHAEATLTFYNTEVHNGQERITLQYEDIVVVVMFTWNVRETPAEALEVLPPDGYIAIPQYIEANEGETVEVQIVKGYVG